jgi:uncharacterized protein
LSAGRGAGAIVPTAMPALVLDEVLPLHNEAGRFVFHVPTSAFYEVDDLSLRLLSEVERQGRVDEAAFGNGLAERLGVPGEELTALALDLRALRVLVPEGERGARPAATRDQPKIRDGVTNLVLHVAHTCNLGCGYCYAEQGLYKGRAELMTEDRAREYVDWLLGQADPEARSIGITFFGGEPLLNFDVVRIAAEHAQLRARERGVSLRFSMTTNGTLVTEEIATFLASIGCQVTVSLDGVGRVNDRLRPFHSGKGSYDLVMERIAPLLATKSAVARVTVTRQNLDVVETVTRLLEAGFAEVGCAAVDAKNPAFDLQGHDFDVLLDGFRILTRRFIEEAAQGRKYGFSNIGNLLKSIHSGHNKDYPCGAGISMVAGAPNGEMSLCHRFVGEKEWVLGRVQDGGLDQTKRKHTLEVIHLEQRTDCGSCWARYICSGGCHHVNFLFGGHPSQTYTTHCDWLRAWYKVGVETYAEILARNPSYITRFVDPGYQCGR